MVQENCIRSYDGIIILGPTATGKTGLSIKLAKLLNTEIINADSMYIYKDLNIGTAKPTSNEMSGIKHHLISIVNPEECFNVSDYRQLAKNVIIEFQKNNKLPIIVGGTGFYIDSIINNYSYGTAEKDINLRQSLEDDLIKYGKEFLHNKLKSLDEESANRIHCNDTKRVIRALEIVMTTENKMSNIENIEKPLLNNPLLIGLNMDRELLYDRINKRVDIMVNDGLIDEVKSLVNRGLTPSLHQSMKGIGYKEIVDYLNKEISLDDAINLIKQHTRNYAKRQITWFKRNESIHWFNPFDENIEEKIMNLLQKKI